VLLCVLCTACGFGGGYVANQYTGGNLLNFPTKETPVQEEVQTEDLEVQEEVVKQEKPTQAPQVIYQGFSVKDIAAKVTPSVVEIKTETIATSFFFQEYVAEGAGSGVIISEDGYIVTNNHVVENSKSVSVTLNDGTSYEAKVIGTDSKTDIAILKIEAEGLTAAEIGDSSELVVGDNVIAVGNPLGSLGGTVTDGIVSALERELTIENETFNLLQTNAAINPGNSGGGLFNDKGELIGIVNAKEMLTANGYSVEGLGFAIPINDVKVIMDDIMQNGYVVNRPTIGVYLTEIAQDQGEYKAGVYITQIIEGSGAEAAGLEAYDRIIAVDDKEVTSYSELSKLLKNYKVGDTIKITVVRDGTQVTADVTLTQAIVQNETVEE
ncbi:MAG: trypsin-like peptidase domain-containing protein, partial [Erysipelotrichaceae bacterium]|nr:trypsin-like peptidase domain-containing protein [Erysipelotrichaceae bacterium]